MAKTYYTDSNGRRMSSDQLAAARDNRNLQQAQTTADMGSIMNGSAIYRGGALQQMPNQKQSAASVFGSMTGAGGSYGGAAGGYQWDPQRGLIAPGSGGGASNPMVGGPEMFQSAITGGLNSAQSMDLRNYYNQGLWNSFNGTDESATGGMGGAGGGGGGAGGGGNLSGTTLNYSNMGPERLQAQNSLDLALLGQQGRQLSLGQILPLLNQAFSSFGGSGGGNLTGSQPTINAGPIYTPGQTQRQVNTAVAGNDGRFAGLMRSLAGRFGSSGFSPNSAAYQGLAAQLAARNSADNAGIRTSVPFDMAQANAGQLLSSQSAQENQFSNRRQEQLGSQRNAISMLASVLGLV